jgi:predicted Rossmann-fold nucleotide-binding protein
MRNQQMIDDGKPDVVIAFPGGSGTADMIRRAEAAGVKVIRMGGET